MATRSAGGLPWLACLAVVCPVIALSAQGYFADAKNRELFTVAHGRGGRERATDAPDEPEKKFERARMFAWQTASPESQGMSAAKLDALKDDLAARKTKAFLVVRNDRIVYEWYASDHGPEKRHGTASLAKALIGGLDLAVALTDEKIALDDRVAKYVAVWAADPRKAKITIRQLGSHTSGLSDAEGDVPHERLPGWKGEFWRRLPPPHDPFTLARDAAPVLFEPGTRIQYSNPGIAMLTYAVTAALGDMPAKDARSLLRDRVMRPIGIADAEWSAGYDQIFQVDGLPLVAAWGGASFTARAAARLGRLVARGGDWEGSRILSAGAVGKVTGDAGLPGHCGMGWWTNAAGRYAKVPKDAVWGAGAGDQILLVVPSLNLIMVRNGGPLTSPRTPPVGAKLDVFEQFHDERTKILFDPLFDALLPAVVPSSPVVTGVVWAPPETILRDAQDSDLWASTWADDGHIYTVYGDGTGFAPKVPAKLSQGLARIEGGPDAFKGFNIRSATFERFGNGPKGPKASGILMVDGTLFALVRNTGNSQLAWSADRGVNWQWADWKFTTGMGCPTFVNFGANYAGARDDYVYIVSHDADTAYQVAERFVLARVPKSRLREKDAYEYFAGRSAGGGPAWSRSPVARAGILAPPNKCYRCTVSYNAGLKRYLLCQAGSDRKTDVGFGIFDAPEPWGPWTVAFYARHWDVSPGESCSFPTKWMSADGKTLDLVFSGDDSFKVRRVVLTTAGGH